MSGATILGPWDEVPEPFRSSYSLADRSHRLLANIWCAGACCDGGHYPIRFGTPGDYDGRDDEAACPLCQAKNERDALKRELQDWRERIIARADAAITEPVDGYAYEASVVRQFIAAARSAGAPVVDRTSREP